jgi:ribose transport system substrate-binding protein
MPFTRRSSRVPGALAPDHPAARARRARPVIGVSMLTVDVEFHRELKAGLEKAAREAEFELVVSLADYSPVEQDEQLASFVAGGGVDAILLTPCDSASAGASIEKANRLGVPVFTIDVAVTGGRGAVVSHIASDNVLGGRKAGELMARALGGRGNVVIVTHPGVTSVVDRVRGFREAVAETEGLLVVGELPVWRHTRAQAAELVSRLLAGAAVDGVFAINSELALGAAEGIDAAGEVGRVVVVGFDGALEVREAIQRGRIHGDVVQHPEAIAALAIGAIRDHLAGRPVPPVISADVDVRTAGPASRER